jgi:hypothetical protein
MEFLRTFALVYSKKPILRIVKSNRTAIVANTNYLKSTQAALLSVVIQIFDRFEAGSA